MKISPRILIPAICLVAVGLALSHYSLSKRLARAESDNVQIAEKLARAAENLYIVKLQADVEDAIGRSEYSDLHIRFVVLASGGGALDADGIRRQSTYKIVFNRNLAPDEGESLRTLVPEFSSIVQGNNLSTAGLRWTVQPTDATSLNTPTNSILVTVGYEVDRAMN